MSTNATDNPTDFTDQGQASRFGRRFRSGLLKLVLAALVLGLIGSSILMVDESQYVLVDRLGHIVAVYDRPEDRGLHFKLPWPVSTVRRFDRRIQLFDPPGREIFTRDKKNITVDAYVCWKIADPEKTSGDSLDRRPVVRFFRGLGSLDVAEARLDSRIRSVLSTQIGQVELSRFLNIDDSERGPQQTNMGLLEKLSDEIRQEVDQRSGEENSITERLGIEIVDARIKRLNLPQGNQQAVFERMKSERKKIADRYRSAGMAENTVIRSQADRQYEEILARANADAERVRGEAEAEAVGILNRAHAQDPEFYRIIRTLDTYRKILNEKTTLVLSASSNLLKMLTEGVPEPSELPPPPAKPSPTNPEEADSPKPKVSEASTVKEQSGPDGTSKPEAEIGKTKITASEDKKTQQEESP